MLSLRPARHASLALRLSCLTLTSSMPPTSRSTVASIRPSSTSTTIESTTAVPPAEVLAKPKSKSKTKNPTVRLTAIPPTLVPPYPFGPATTYKQSNRGLYGGVKKQYGHSVTESSFRTRRNVAVHRVKTRRNWKPNVHRLALWSDALSCNVRTRLTMRVLRTIRKSGGLDAYLLKPGPRRMRELGPGGWRLRWLVMQAAATRDRFRQERSALGVPEGFLESQRPDDVTAREDLVVALSAADDAKGGELSDEAREILRRREQEVRDLALGEEFGLGDDAEFDGGEGPEGTAAEDAREEHDSRPLAEEDGGMAKRMGFRASDKTP